MIADALPPLLGSSLDPSELEVLRRRLTSLPEPAHRTLFHKEDWLGAVAVFILVFGTTFPVIIPFLFMSDAWLALRVSNGIAIAMLCGAGWRYAPFIGHRPWVVAVAMVVLGVGLVGLTVALGG